MIITNYTISFIQPPNDSFLLLSLTTDTGITGWGEITGSGNDSTTAKLAKDYIQLIIGNDPLNMEDCFNHYSIVSQLPISVRRCGITAWSGISQAIWDINAKAQNLPLNKLLSKTTKDKVSLYANLNRGLLKNRTPLAFATHAENAIKEGFAFVKATPFDEITASCIDKIKLEPAMARLKAIYQRVETTSVAVDCHWRFNPLLAKDFMLMQKNYGDLYWVEDLLDRSLSELEIAAFRAEFQNVTWAGGEDLTTVKEGLELILSVARPDIFMPDIKHIFNINDLKTLYNRARIQNCALSGHNPSGPIATAFSVHIASAVEFDEPLEFPFKAVLDRNELLISSENIENGIYYLTDRPGIGVEINSEALESYGTLIYKGYV